VTVSRCCGEIISIESKGHSGYAQHGKDIVCAAVSALMQALLVGIQEICGKHLECSLIESNGFFKLFWSADIIPEIKLLSETIALSLRRIADAYPKNLEFSEVQVVNESVQSSDFRP
jgi:uncharacterized protein YsxB (DUF464 family)